MLIVALFLMLVVQTAKHEQESRTKLGGIQGSWGTWGTWSTCSSTCGNGIQRQTRHCLPIYTQPQNAFRVVSSPHQQPGLIISALQPTVSLHSDTDRLTNSLTRGELSKAKQTGPAVRRYFIIKFRGLGFRHTITNVVSHILICQQISMLV